MIQYILYDTFLFHDVCKFRVSKLVTQMRLIIKFVYMLISNSQIEKSDDMLILSLFVFFSMGRE